MLPGTGADTAQPRGDAVLKLIRCQLYDGVAITLNKASQQEHYLDRKWDQDMYQSQNSVAITGGPLRTCEMMYCASNREILMRLPENLDAIVRD